MTSKSPFDYQHVSVRDFMILGNQLCPSSPFIPEKSIRRLRAKLIMEEAVETAEGLGFFPHWINGELELVENFTPDIIKVADGCADLKVVTVGTEVAFGFGGRPIFEEVMRSNMTKDFSGAKRPDGKILKGPTYEPPNIERVLQLQGWKA